MIIGIDGSRAFLKQRTGIEEYSYQVIKNFRNKLEDFQVVLYLRKGQKVDFDLPKNLLADEAGWKIKVLKWSRLWTQAGLSLEMLFHPVDILFIPAHTAPFIHPTHNISFFSLGLFIQKILKKLGIETYYNLHSDASGPKKTFVVIHGLEYEVIKEAYSFLSRFYMRWSIKFSCRAAKKIIAVSKNTKKDLIDLYKIPENKIEVVYEGVVENFQSIYNNKILNYKPYLLFIGRLETRKNIIGIIKAFEILKERYNISHKLILAGKAGFGYQEIKNKIKNSRYRNEIIETGFLKEENKEDLIRNSEVFLFPTFYEGFGLPILESQVLGVPVVTSNVSSLPEIGGDSVAYCTPQKPKSIADSIYKIISDENFKDAIIKKGYENVKRFSWEKCVKQIMEVILE